MKASHVLHYLNIADAHRRAQRPEAEDENIDLTAGDGDFLPATILSTSSFMDFPSKPSQPVQEDLNPVGLPDYTENTVAEQDTTNNTAIVQADSIDNQLTYEPVDSAMIQIEQVDFDPTETSDDLNVTRDDLRQVHDDLSGTQEEKLEQRISNPFSPASMVPAAAEDDDDDDDL